MQFKNGQIVVTWKKNFKEENKNSTMGMCYFKNLKSKHKNNKIHTSPVKMWNYSKRREGKESFPIVIEFWSKITAINILSSAILVISECVSVFLCVSSCKWMWVCVCVCARTCTHEGISGSVPRNQQLSLVLPTHICLLQN